MPSPPTPPAPKELLSPSRKAGRRVAQLLFWIVVSLVSLAGAVEITAQVYFAPTPPPPSESCQEGLRSLLGAVDRARLAAAGADGEDAALDRFRRALDPEWSSRDGVAARCRGKAPDEGALDAIERLRYAEEHAVRREAGELAPLRRRVQGIIDRELLPKAPP